MTDFVVVYGETGRGDICRRASFGEQTILSMGDAHRRGGAALLFFTPEPRVHFTFNFDVAFRVSHLDLQPLFWFKWSIRSSQVSQPFFPVAFQSFPASSSKIVSKVVVPFVRNCSVIVGHKNVPDD